jgi:hypothetical protein
MMASGYSYPMPFTFSRVIQMRMDGPFNWGLIGSAA